MQFQLNAADRMNNLPQSDSNPRCSAACTYPIRFAT
jgi:hypothetical protein